MQSDIENCKTCGKVKSGTSRGATITQWISMCQCDMLNSVNPLQADIVEDLRQTCETCGKRIETKRAGSLTQWIFRESSCRCDAPQSQTLRLHSEKPSKTPIRHTDTSEEEVEVEEEEEEEESQEDDQDIEPDGDELKHRGNVQSWAKVLLALLCVIAVAESFLIVFPSSTPLPVVHKEEEVVRDITEPQMMKKPVSSDIFSLVENGYLGMSVDGTKVIETLPCMPAEGAGIRKGDRVISINSRNVEQAKTTEINELLKGEAGSIVTLTVIRGKEKRILNLERAANTFALIPRNLSPVEYYNLGIRQRKSGRPNESRLAFSLAAANDHGLIGEMSKQEMRSELPAHYVPFGALALNNQAHNLLKSGDTSAATTLFRKCINRYPNFEWPYLNLAIASNIMNGAIDEPEQLIRKVISINPKLTNAWIAMSMITELKGNMKESNACMQKARELNPNADREHQSLIRMVEKQRQMAELIKSQDQ